MGNLGRNLGFVAILEEMRMENIRGNLFKSGEK